ncbi:MAG TPA: thioredoxin family protein [Candidatus Aminicenantes bacterium]|nr:thioredoxin family protein [Candidatus Aminicenantes bacterium]
MKKTAIFVSAVWFCLTLSATAARPADELVAQACARAGREHKTVLVMFHASWCKYCKKLEAVLALPEVGRVIDRHFVPLWLTVMERGELKATENPGAAELLKELARGASTGIPYCACLDSQRRMRSDSMFTPAGAKEPGNIGFPVSEEETAAFLAMLRKGAPRLTAAELDTLKEGIVSLQPAK